MRVLPLAIALVGCGGASPKGPIQPRHREIRKDGGGGDKSNKATPTSGLPADQLTGVRELACGTATTCAVTKTGGVYCWGDEYALGLPPDTTAHRPLRIPKLPAIEHVGVGTSAACALGVDHHVYCWGLAPFDVPQRPPTPAKELVVGTVAMNGAPLEAVELSVGPTHACARDGAGDVLCWGDKRDGKVGVPWQRGGGAWDVRVPTAVRALPLATRVVAGMNSTCAIAADGSLRCFGSNELANLGVATPAPWTHVPQVVPLATPVRDVSLGDASCAIDGGGAVVCWGVDDFGQAGDPSHVGPTKPLSSRPNGMKGFVVAAPRRVPGLDGSLAIHAGGTFTCAIRADHTVACWGNNELGALAASADNDPHPEPRAVEGIDRVHAMCTGAYHACAVVGDGAVSCWGYNASGQLGRDATSPFESEPAPVVAPQP